MEHEMLLLDADFKPVARMVARRKENKHCRVSSDDRASDSYPEYGSLILPLGSTFEERE
jgi:hypothetical protein